MPRIDFKTIRGRNFNSYKEFELPVVPGKHLVLGVNGCGKSTIFESIPWTIHKEYKRSNDPSYNGLGNCMSGLDFNIGDDEYTIDRFWKHSKEGNSATLTLNGTDVSQRLTNSVDDEIAKIIPIPYDLFISTCVIMQGIPVNFTQFTPNVRKTIIEGALGYSVWDKLRKKFTTSRDELAGRVKAMKDTYAEKERQMVDLNARIEAMQDAEDTKSADIKLRYDAVKKELLELKRKRDILTEKHKGLTGENTIDSLKDKLDTLRTKQTLQKKVIDDLNSIIENKVCPTCQASFEDEDKLSSLQEQCEKCCGKLTTIDGLVEKHQALIKEIEGVEREANQVDITTRNKKQELARISSEAKPKDDSDSSLVLAGYQEKLQALVDGINVYNEELLAVEKDLEHVSFIDSMLLPSSTFRTQVLAKHLAHISGILKTVAPLVFDGITVTLDINKQATGIDINIFRKGRNIGYKTLSGGEKRRLDVIIILAFQRFLIEASGVNTNMVVFDEVFDGLDAKGVDAILGCLESLFPEDMAVYVITHNESLKSRFESIIRIEKEDDCSRLAS